MEAYRIWSLTMFLITTAALPSFVFLHLPTQPESGKRFNTKEGGELFSTSERKCLMVGSWTPRSNDSKTRAAFTAAEFCRIRTVDCVLKRRIDARWTREESRSLLVRLAACEVVFGAQGECAQWFSATV
jgi:hypothetical protein